MPDEFGLYLVLTDPVAGYEACAAAAVETGVRYVQLRMKHSAKHEILAMAHRLRRITAGTATRFIVNDDVEIARECGADGVHLGQNDMPLAEARRLWPAPGRIFGLSTHDEEQAATAGGLAPDYIGVGPVYATPTKEKPDPVLGPERTGDIIRHTPLTTVAIGGINAQNLPTVLACGATNFAVVRAVTQAANPKAAILNLQRVWEEHRQRRRDTSPLRPRL